MHWCSIDELMYDIVMPQGYSIERLTRADVPGIARSLSQWFPELVVGSESRHLTEAFYYQNVEFPDSEEAEGGGKDTIGLVLRHHHDPRAAVGLMMLSKDEPSKALTSRIGALAPEHRRGAVGFLGVLILEAAARIMGAGVAYSYVTMRSRHQQVIAERYGFQLVGIMPAWDIAMIEPGRPKRVFEAVFAKVYAPESEWHIPPRSAMTKRTRELWDFLFAPRA
jgi:hypothetical protein